MNIAIVGGQWGQNIGNAFFNLGGMYVFESIGPSNVGFFQDQPNYRTLHNKFNGNPKNYIDLISRMKIDYVVLQGPVLNAWLRQSWETAFKELKKRDIKIIFHSCAFFKFTDKEINHVRKFFNDFPPHMVVTRDPETFKILNSFGVVKNIRSGIDAGFFVNKAHKTFDIKDEYFVMNFDRYPEPNLELDINKINKNKNETREILINEKKWFISIPKFQNNLSHKSKIKAYIGDLLDRRRLKEKFDGMSIIRTEHRFFPHITNKIYKNPNSTASDEPWTYLNIYSNASFTLSDRVHACVATLSYGNSAMLFTPSPRKALFDRLKLSNISNELVKLDADYLKNEQDAHIQWISNNI